MRRIKQLFIAFAAPIGIIGLSLAPQPVGAIDIFDNTCKNAPNSTICANRGDDAIAMTKSIVNLMLLLLGMVAVIAIIIGGYRYVTSNGDPQSTKAAKDTILYAVVGLVVAIAAYAIVNFVTSRL